MASPWLTACRIVVNLFVLPTQCNLIQCMVEALLNVCSVRSRSSTSMSSLLCCRRPSVKCRSKKAEDGGRCYCVGIAQDSRLRQLGHVRHRRADMACYTINPALQIVFAVVNLERSKLLEILEHRRVHKRLSVKFVRSCSFLDMISRNVYCID